MRPTFNLIGSGQVGKTLAKLFHEGHLVELLGVCNQSLESAQAGVDWIGAGRAYSSLLELPEAEITLLAVPDSQIAPICAAWLQSPSAQPGTVVFHLSGALTSEVLAGTQERGIYRASVHPLKSFASPEEAYQSFIGTFCAVEGEAEALRQLCPLFESLGAQLQTIKPEFKPLYHAACVMACGGLTALYAACQDLYLQVGISKEQSRAFLAPYMKLTLDNNQLLGPAGALTGPVARKDTLTIEAHQLALAQQDPLVQELYRVLSELQIF